MSCRAACTRVGEEERLRATDGAAAALCDLVVAGRRDDFDWLARSQGLSAGEADALWRAIARRLPRSAAHEQG